MVYALYTLKEKYRDMDIYIWNINRDSMGVFMRAALRKISIRGFVTDREEYAGNWYMNRPIEFLPRILKDENSIIIVGDDVPAEFVKMFPKKMIYWSDEQEINSGLYQRRNVIYGIGKGADQLCTALDDKKINIELFCVSECKYPNAYHGKEVLRISDMYAWGGV